MLTPKKHRFVEEYLLDLNGSQAAIRAGYSRHTANRAAARLMSEPEVSAAIEEAKAARGERTAIDADYVLWRLVREASADIAEIYDEKGDLLPVEEWPLIFRQGLVAGVEIDALYEGQGENRVQVGQVKKVRFESRIRRLELIGKHIGVNAFQEQIAVTGLDGLADRLARARAREEERCRTIDAVRFTDVPHAGEIAPPAPSAETSSPEARPILPPPRQDEAETSPPASHAPITRRPTLRPFGGNRKYEP